MPAMCDTKHDFRSALARVAKYRWLWPTKVSRGVSGVDQVGYRYLLAERYKLRGVKYNRL